MKGLAVGINGRLPRTEQQALCSLNRNCLREPELILPGPWAYLFHVRHLSPSQVKVCDMSVVLATAFVLRSQLGASAPRCDVLGQRLFRQGARRAQTSRVSDDLAATVPRSSQAKAASRGATVSCSGATRRAYSDRTNPVRAPAPRRTNRCSEDRYGSWPSTSNPVHFGRLKTLRLRVGRLAA